MNLLTDKPSKLFRSFLLPSVGGTLIYTIYSFVDMIAIGHGVGPEGTAATAILLPLFQLPSFISILCGIGGSVQIGTSRGAGNKEEADRHFTESLIGITVLILLTWAAEWFFRVPIMKFLGADDTILPYALAYGEKIIIGVPFFTMCGFLPFILRNDGNHNLPLTACICGGLVNMFGDWLLVFPLGLGMAGAGLATLAGSIVQFLILTTHFLSKKTTLKLRRPNKTIKSVLRLFPFGFGSAFMEISTIVTTILMNNLILKYGTLADLTVYGFLLTVVALIQFICLGIGQAAQPIISTNHGAGLSDRVRKTQELNKITTLIFAVSCMVFSLVFPQLITDIFVMRTPEVSAVAPRIIRIFVLHLPFLALNMASISNLQAVQKDKEANRITLLRGLFVNTICLLVMPLIMGSKGIWWAVVISESLVCLISYASAAKTVPSV